MITKISGRMVEKSPTELVIDCNGIGYLVNISLNTYSKIGDDENISLFTYLQVKEDSHTLFGFCDKQERNLFKKLISVSGIGASTARTMLSSLSPEEIQNAIVSENVSIPVIASGGMGNIDHATSVIKDSKADAIAIANVLHYGKISTRTLRNKLIDKNINVRRLYQ